MVVFSLQHCSLALVCIAWVRKVEAEHGAHIEHIKEENGGELPEVPEYDYMNKRERPFPWGMNSLFFNAHVSGYNTVFFPLPHQSCNFISADQ